MLDKTISNFIEQQFPEYYREEGPFLVEFLKQYYVWLETDPTSPVYLARQYLSDHDVDTTVDNFIVFFKEKYLKIIQLNTATNTKQLIKNSIDLYRSKGTENAIKLFFDLIFSAPSEVYYPGNDVFKLSDAEWNIPHYIEVTSKPINRLLVGRQIRGVYSGATAFVEKLVRRKVNSTYIEVFYISAVNGNFRTGEIVTISSNNDYPIDDFPQMVGSLTDLSVEDGGDGFKKGEVVKLQSRTGSQGLAIVQELETITGIVDFTLTNGGWGYTSNSDIEVSEKVLQLSNVRLQTTDNTSLYEKMTTIYQPMANVQWYDNTASFSVGDVVFNYEANGAVRGVSTIISAEYGTSNTTNYFLMATNFGNSAPYAPMVYSYYKSGNTASFKVYNAGHTDRTAKGTRTGLSSNVSLYCIGNAAAFSPNSAIYQKSSNNQIFARAKISTVSSITANTFTLKVNDLDGMFLNNFALYNESTNSTATINTASFDIGVRDISGTFISTARNVIVDREANSLFRATVNQIPFGSGASVGFDTDLVNVENVMINPNYVRDHIDETEQRNWVNAESYGASLNNANLLSPILGEALRFEPKALGTIARLKFENPGQGYSYSPFVVAVDPLIAPLHKMDFVIRLKNATGVFVLGELVTQQAQGAKGIVKFANTSEVHIRRLTYEDRWSVGNTTPYIINGESSGFSAIPIEVTEDIEGIAGMNAVIDTKVTSSNSAVKKLKVSDSGFNYRDSDKVTFISMDDSRSGQAVGYVATQGTGSGFYKTTSGFLSANKYIYDGEYYQDFSYEIRSPITIGRYSDMLKNILHVAGTKAFSSIVKHTIIDATTKSSSTMTTNIEGT